MRVLQVVGRPAELRGPLKHFKWLTRTFGQDTTLIYNSFEEAAQDHIASLASADRQALLVQVNAIIADLDSEPPDSEDVLETYWFQFGAEWWPEQKSLMSGLIVIRNLLMDRMAE